MTDYDSIFTGKHLCWSLFYNKVAGQGLQLYYERDFNTDFYNFKQTPWPVVIAWLDINKYYKCRFISTILVIMGFGIINFLCSIYYKITKEDYQCINNKYKYSGPLTFNSPRYSIQKLLHRYQHATNQLISSIHHWDRAEFGVTRLKRTHTFLTTPTKKLLK